MILVYHPACPSCQRFMEALRRAAATDAEAAGVRPVDITTMSAGQRAAITSVPTLVADDGRRIAGTKAFEWLDQHRAEPAPFVGGFGSIGFSGVTGGAAGEGFQQSYAPID